MEKQDSDIQPMIVRRNIAVSTIFFLIFIGAIVFHNVEHWGWIDSFYYIVATSATVGYGDVTPQTDLGKVLATIFIIIMVPIILYSFTIIAEIFFERRVRHRTEKNNSSK